MKNYVVIGPVRIRVNSKHLAPWGFPTISIGGLSLFSWTNTGGLTLASYQPPGETWHWSFCIQRREYPKGWISKDPIRRGQWHDYYRLPFGLELVHSRQDWHVH
jgi:hypothetical protein